MSALLLLILQLVSFTLFARAISSWIPTRHGSGPDRVKRSLHGVTEPIVGPVRRRLPSVAGLDFSVLAVLLAINFFLVPLAVALPA